jgi:hypothetical protein
MGGSLTKLWAWPELGMNEPFPLPIPFGDYRAASVVQKR